MLQRLTTREPDDDMIEVAIAAVEAVFDWKQYFIDEFGYDVDAYVQDIEEEPEPESQRMTISAEEILSIIRDEKM